MFGINVTRGRKSRDEAEKPFWISYADMMTALMVLFLVVMSVALLAATKELTEVEKGENERKDAIDQCLAELVSDARQFPGVIVNTVSMTVDFGVQALFDIDNASLTQAQKLYLRRFAPVVLNMAGKECGRRWLKRIVVEGFTDDTGTYLHNVDLSLRRSESVLCALLEDDGTLSRADREEITRLFFVGGFSSNSLKKTKDESRRIELKLEFKGFEKTAGEKREDVIHVPVSLERLGVCAVR